MIYTAIYSLKSQYKVSKTDRRFQKTDCIFQKTDSELSGFGRSFSEKQTGMLVFQSGKQKKYPCAARHTDRFYTKITFLLANVDK